MDLQGLVDRSPFAAPASAGVTVPTEQAATLEFRGLAADQEGTVYSVFDATANRGYWLREGGEAGAIRLKHFDEAAGVLEIEQAGRPLRLELKSARTAAMPFAVAGARATSGTGRRTRSSSAVAGASGTADAERLAKVVAEARRRSEQRRAAAQAAARGEARR